jgi:hypothetical protein
MMQTIRISAGSALRPFAAITAGGAPAAENHRAEESEQERQLRCRIAKLEAEFDGIELGPRPREQEITIAHGVQGAGAAEGAADLVAAMDLRTWWTYDFNSNVHL